MRQNRDINQRGVALVTTVIVIAVLAVVAVAFMQSTSMDRLSSRTVSNYYKAQLAAEAGLAEFMADLGEMVAQGDFTVLELAVPEDPTRRYTALLKFNADGQATCIPFASRSGGSTPIELPAPFDLPGMFGAVQGAIGSGATNLVKVMSKYAKANPVIAYPASDPEDLVLNAELVAVYEDESAQFAYIAVDESAKLNTVAFGGGYEGQPRAEQSVGDFAGEVALADAGEHTVSLDHLQRFNSLTRGLRIGAIWPSLFGSLSERASKQRFYSGHGGQILDIIPPGYLDDELSEWTNFPDGGEPKFEMNELARGDGDAISKVHRIAEIIDRNLPDWHKRDFSLLQSKLKPVNPNQRYSRRIAAAIVDYIDDDSEIALLEDNEPAGKEPVAYPFKIAERYDWVNAQQKEDNGSGITMWDLTIRHTLFVELWNPHTVPVSGNFEIELKTEREYGHPTPDDNPFNIPALKGEVSVSLKPNEINVYEIAQEEFTVTVPGGPDTPNTPITAEQTTSQNSLNAERRNHSRYKAQWNGRLYSYTPNEIGMFNVRGPGLVKEEATLRFSAAADRANWQANVPQTPLPINGVYRGVGDPRDHHLSNYPWQTFSYTGASARFKGAMAAEVNSPQTQAFPQTWARRDVMRAALTAGSRPASANQNPTAVSATYNEEVDGPNAPAFIRNDKMETIAELGHIHDSASLDDAGANAGTAGTPDSYFGLSGARSLRIGQPEYSYPSYDKPGQRAYSLLDLFTTDYGKGPMGERLSGINLNTAPEEVLTSFFYDIALRSDEGAAPSGNSPRLTLEGAKNIAQAVIENRPYFISSDFRKFTGALVDGANFSPSIATNAAGALNILDRGREEVFRRSYNFLETKSGAFKFYGVGRVLDAAGKVLSEAALEAQVELRAESDAGGNVRLRPIVTQRKFL